MKTLELLFAERITDLELEYMLLLKQKDEFSLRGHSGKGEYRVRVNFG